MKPMFTPEELEEMRRADEEIEENFVLSNEELAAARERDRRHKFNEMDDKGQKYAETKRRYYEANREKVADYNRRYYEANREKVADYQRRYYEANREKIAETKRQELKTFRKEHGLTQSKFGAPLGVTKSTVCRWENGELEMDEERIRAAYPLFEIREETA